MTLGVQCFLPLLSKRIHSDAQMLCVENQKKRCNVTVTIVSALFLPAARKVVSMKLQTRYNSMLYMGAP